MTNITTEVIIKFRKIEVSPRAQKQIIKLPFYIQEKLYLWFFEINRLGLEEIQKTKGFHDEPLKGKRLGQRSIRLNRSFRAIYQVMDDGLIEVIYILEVNKHEY